MQSIHVKCLLILKNGNSSRFLFHHLKTSLHQPVLILKQSYQAANTMTLIKANQLGMHAICRPFVLQCPTGGDQNTPVLFQHSLHRKPWKPSLNIIKKWRSPLNLTPKVPATIYGSLVHPRASPADFFTQHMRCTIIHTLLYMCLQENPCIKNTPCLNRTADNWPPLTSVHQGWSMICKHE